MLKQTIERLRMRVAESPASVTVLKTGGVALTIKVGGALIAYATHVVLARLLGGEGYGHYIYAFAWAQLAMLLGVFGQDTAGLRFVGAYLGENQLARLIGFVRFSRWTVFATSLMAAILFAAVGYRLPESGDPLLRQAFFAAAFLIPVGCLLQWHSAVLRGLQHVVAGMMALEVWRPLGILTGALLAFKVIRIWEPTAGTALGINLGVSTILLISLVVVLQRLLPEARPESSPALRREWVAVALPMMLMSGMHMVLTRIDLLMIGAKLGPETAGVYGAVSRTTVLVVFCVLAVNSIAAPMMSRLYAARDNREFRVMATWSTWAMVLAAIPVASLLVLFGPWILGLFGAGFLVGYPALVVFAVGQILHAAFGLAGFMTTMTGHERYASRTLAAAVALNAVLNFVLIPIWGLVGAALATNVSKLAWNLVLARYLKRELGIDWRDLMLGRYLADEDLRNGNGMRR